MTVEGDLEKDLASAGIYRIGAPGAAEVPERVVGRSQETPPGIDVARPQSGPDRESDGQSNP